MARLPLMVLIVAWLSGAGMMASVDRRQSPAAVPREPAVSVDARAVQPGEIVVLTVTTGAPATSVRARAFDRDWPGFQVDPTAWRILVGLDLDTKPGAYDVLVAVDRMRVTESLTVTSKSFPTRRLTVAPQYVNPPPDVQARITREAVRLNGIWESSADRRLWSGPFARPVPQPANSAFGTRSVFNGQPRSPHGGADFLSPSGAPVHAPNAGHVVLAEDLYYTGNTVVIDHGLGLVSLFAHLSRIDVAEGDDVTTGDVLGLVGSTGRVTGPHLHWTLRAGGARVDPLSLLAVLGR